MNAVQAMRASIPILGIGAACAWRHQPGRCSEDPAAPRVVALISGKRKSGKDYSTEILLGMLGGDVAEVGRLSGPLKKAYAEEHGLDYERLLSADSYKEKYRKDMIHWGQRRREADPGFFARIVVGQCEKPILVVSDARRLSDLEYFLGKDRFRDATVTVRVRASEESRRSRGWQFKEGVDDNESECGLDGFEGWTYVVDNDGDEEKLQEELQKLARHLRRMAGAQADA